MAAFQTVWSVDVGKSSLKAVKMHRERNSIEILAVDKVDFPVEAGGIESLQAPKDALRTFASRNEINCPVVVSHPGHSAFSRFIQLPPVDAKKLEEMIGYEAQQQIPFPIDEVIWDYHVCETDDDALEKEVGIFAVRKEVISDFILDFEQGGISPDHISVGYVGLLNYVQFDLRPQKPAVIIDIGSDHTDLLIVDGGRFWVRNLGIAGNDFTQAIQEKFKLQFDEAEKIKQTAGSNKEQAAKVYTTIQPILKELVNEIHRSVGFYKSQAGDVKFEDVFLFGNAGRLVGIQRFLQEHLRFNVHVEKGFRRIRVNRESNVALLQQDFLSFATGVGQGIQALGDGVCDINLLPQERQEEISFKSKQKVVIGAAASLFIVVAFLFVHFNGKIDRADAALEDAKMASSLDKNSKTLKKLETESEELAAAATELELIALDRKQPSEALAAVSALFAGFGNDRAVTTSTSVPATADGGVDLSTVDLGDAESEQRDLNNKKAWLVGIDGMRVRLDANGDVVGKKSSNDKTPTVWAYQFDLFGAIEVQGSPKDNNDFVQQRILMPLQAELRRRTGNDSLTVTNMPLADTAANSIYRKHPKFRSGGRGVGDEQEQGEFFLFQLRWNQHSQPLPTTADAEKE